MEASVQFLLRWRRIIKDPGREWLVNYPRALDAYIHPKADLSNLEAVEFCLPNYDKSRKERSTYEFPPGSKAKNLQEASKIIIVFKKKNQGT